MTQPQMDAGRRRSDAGGCTCARWVLALLCGSLMSVNTTRAAQEQQPGPEHNTVAPVDTGDALHNPGMGWVLYAYDHHLDRYGARLAPDDTVEDFPGVTTVYMAIPWSFLEPAEGEYDWSLIDRATEKWTAAGKQIALRFPCCEPFYAYATPKWVQDAGARFDRFETTERTRNWIRQSLDREIPTHCWAPDYSDPIFLEKHGNFLRAAAVRFDGNPDVAFIDVGSFGTWGEGHTSFSGGRHYDAAAKIKHLDLYAAHFTNTVLVAGDDLLKIQHRDSKPLIDRAVELDMALRDDSVLVGNRARVAESEGMAARFWPRKPVILESAHYGMAVAWWDSWGDGSLYLESIERYHASYAGVHWWPREFLAENRTLVDNANLRLGYRIQLTHASWPARSAVGVPFRFECTLRNAGVAPCLPGGHPTLTLKSANGDIALVIVDTDFDVRTLAAAGRGVAAGEARTTGISSRPDHGLAPGHYTLFFSIGTREGTPRIALPLEGCDGQRRYRLGMLDVPPTHEAQP